MCKRVFGILLFFWFLLLATGVWAQTQEKTDLDYGIRLFNEGLYDLAAM